MGSHYDSDLSIVFEPALGETVSIDTKSSSLVLSAASNNSLDLTAQVSEALCKFDRSYLLSLSDGVELHQAFVNLSLFSCDAPTEISIIKYPLPLHLQGPWNDGEANVMNWICDYHLNINTQMNYFVQIL
jgi:alpha-L-fucosidase 2